MSYLFAFSHCLCGSQGKNTEVVKWFAIPFSSGPCFVRTPTMSSPSWVALHGMAHSFAELVKAVVHEIRLVSFFVTVVFSLSAL